MSKMLICGMSRDCLNRKSFNPVPQAENTRKLQQLIGKADKGRDPYGYGYPDRRNAAWVGREKPKKKKKKKKGEEGEEDYMGHMMDPMM